MATSRSTIGALFSLVTKSTQTVIKSLDTVDTVVNTINNSARNMAERHQVDSDLDMINYEAEAVARVAKEATEAAEELDTWKSDSNAPSRAASFDAHHSALLEALETRRKARNGRAK